MTNRIRPDDVNPHAHTDTSLSFTLGRLKPLPIPALPSSTVVFVKNEGHAVLGAMEREMENRMSAQFERKLDDALKAMENRMAAQFEQKLINALQEQSRGMNFSPAVLPQTELRTSVVQAFDGDPLSPHAPLSGGPVLSSGHSAPKTLLRRPTSIRLDTGKTVSPAPVSSPSTPGSLFLSFSPPSSLCSFSHCISYV